MNKQELTTTLISQHKSFTDFLESISDETFVLSRNDKWTPAQHLEHMVRSVRPVTLAFLLPKFVLGLMFGKSNRPSKTYDEVVHKYTQKLAEGVKASGIFVPPPVPLSKRTALIQKLNAVASKLASQANGFSEKDLDTYLLPHPVLGKLTLREMIYFSIYHVYHHHKNLKGGLENAH